jgi:3-oxoacyl-(acyl-carrier-protein) synthase III
MPVAHLPLAVLGTAAVSLPSVSTSVIAERAGVSVADLMRKTGIRARQFAPSGAKFGVLGAEAMRGALARSGMDAAALERLILVTSTGGDDLAPASANHVARALGVGRGLDCFDVNNACTGFLTALDLAARSVATGMGPVGIVVVELLSRFVAPAEPRSLAIFGDGVAAAVVGAPRGRGRILGSYLRNDPADLDAIRMVHPAVSGERALLRFGDSYERIARRSLEVVVESVEEALRRAGTTRAEIRWAVPHQPNGPMLDRMTAAVGVRPEQFVRLIEEQGSMGAAAIPVGLDALLRSGRVEPGDRVLLFGVGGGASYGAMVLEMDGLEA